MSKLTLFPDSIAALQEFCDADTLLNRIELLDELKDKVTFQFAQADSEEERKKLADTMVSLADFKEDLKRIRRAQI